MRKILQFVVALVLVVAPLGSGAIWADQHEKKDPSEASDSKKAESETTSEASTSESATSKAKQAVSAGPVNINTAGTEELQTLPNIGPQKAQAIIDYRNKNGGFKSVEDLKNVSGIGDKTFDGLKQFLKL